VAISDTATAQITTHKNLTIHLILHYLLTEYPERQVSVAIQTTNRKFTVIRIMALQDLIYMDLYMMLNSM
jgi:hypothetical protein